NCDATLMYLRPASCAPRTAAARVSVSLSPASLISIGKLMPAITSTLDLSITEIARLDCVPPNMSVSSTTPWPASTSAMARNMSCRRRSISSSGPMHTAAILRCGPTTCSSAATNSAASLPWVTSTIPIMRHPSQRLARQRGEIRDRRHRGRDRDARPRRAARPAEPGGEPLGHIDRAMAAAGAADGDGEIAFALALVARQQLAEPGAELVEQGGEIGIGGDVIADRAILPGERPQGRDIVRIAEEADVENDIRIARQAAAIGE